MKEGDPEKGVRQALSIISSIPFSCNQKELNLKGINPKFSTSFIDKVIGLWS